MTCYSCGLTWHGDCRVSEDLNRAIYTAAGIPPRSPSADVHEAMSKAILAMAKELDQGWRKMMGSVEEGAQHEFEGLLSVLEQKPET